VFPLAQADFVTVTAVILFLFYIVYSFVGLLLTRKTPPANVPATARFMINKDILIFIAIVVAGLCLNAAITGILSAPYNRYQARVIWLVPFLGMYLACLRNKRLIQLIQSDPLA
jgi:hypothetical protein